MIKINEYFINSYLTPGATRDNFLFEGCSLEFLSCAKNLLEDKKTDTISCVIEIDDSLEKRLEKIYSCFDQNLHKRIISRDYIIAKIMLELLSKSNGDSEIIKDLNDGISAFYSGDSETVKAFHAVAPMPYEITNFYRKNQNFELNFILKNTTNVYLQEAINNLISSREPFSIKVFSNGNLPTYFDQMGNFIQNPHDYMKRDTNSFIEDAPEQTEKQ